MTTSLKTWSNFLSPDDLLSESDKEYFRTRTKRRVHAVLLSKFHEVASNGTTKARLAERLGISPSLITRWLSSPGNIRLETVSDLLLAMRAELEVTSHDLASVGQGNFRHSLSERTSNSLALFDAGPSSKPASQSDDPVVHFSFLPPQRSSMSQTKSS